MKVVFLLKLYRYKLVKRGQVARAFYTKRRFAVV